jgi:hypothetical protein
MNGIRRQSQQQKTAIKKMNSDIGDKTANNRLKHSPMEQTSNQDQEESEIESGNQPSHLNSLDNTIHFQNNLNSNRNGFGEEVAARVGRNQ